MKNILTTKQAAKILEIEPLSVSKAINRGKLKATKWGKQWAIERKEVLRYKEARRIKPKK